MSGDPVLDWLLEPENPSARYLTLTGLLGRAPGDAEAGAARAAIPEWGPARAILEAQWPDGYWMHPGPGYGPPFKGTIWQVLFLAALGAPLVPGVRRAFAYVLDNTRLPGGLFSAGGTLRDAVACLNGNLLWAMARLGYEDERLAESAEALAGFLLRDELRCRCAARPRPARHRDGRPCAWGTLKALGAFAEIPAPQRSPGVRAAIEAGLGLLLPGDLAVGSFPGTGLEEEDGVPEPEWQAPGFPPGYQPDVLEAVEVLARLGVDDGPLAPAREVLLRQRGADGRWKLGRSLRNTWGGFGRAGRPNKWITLRARQVLEGAL